jgi:hypothetical protein
MKFYLPYAWQDYCVTLDLEKHRENIRNKEKAMFDLNDPNTFWLNITNIALGVVTLICCVVVGYAVVQEVLMHVKKRNAKLVESDDHALLVTGLGITMADGGVRVDEKHLAVSEKGIVYDDAKPKRKRRGKK